MILRPDVQALLQDTRPGVFEIVVAEALDRMGRHQAGVAILYKHLKSAGVTVVTPSEGEINELHVGLRGTMNAPFLKDLRRRPGVVCGAASRPASRGEAAATATTW